MAWWNILTSSEKVVDTAADLVSAGASGIDMLFFTDEEKSIASAKIMEQVIAMNKATADENSIRSKTRRSLAKAIIYIYLGLILISVALEMSDATVKAKFVFDVANTALGAHVLAVVIFYFGYYGIKSIVKSVKEK